MAGYFSVKGDTRKPAYFRVSIDMSAFDNNTDGTTGGAVTPNGNFPTSERPYITNLSTLATSTTRATTNILADRRERGLMRFEKMVESLQTDCKNLETFQASFDSIKLSGDTNDKQQKFCPGIGSSTSKSSIFSSSVIL